MSIFDSRVKNENPNVRSSEKFLGTAVVYKQGGSLMSTVPKRAVKEFGLEAGESFAWYKIGRIFVLVPLEYLIDKERIVSELKNSLGKRYQF